MARDDKLRTDFLKACLAKLGLQVNQGTTTVPSLSQIHLSTAEPGAALDLVSSFQEIITTEDGEEYIKDDNDTFLLEKPSSLRMNKLAETLPGSSEDATNESVSDEDRIVDYNTVVKRMVVHDITPETKETPYFNHHAYFSNLKEYQSQSKEAISQFGSNLLYGEVITSTNTILEKYECYYHITPQIGFILTFFN